MAKRNLSIRKNSRSNKNKNKIPKKSKKQVIKREVKGKKGVKATKKQVKNKKKTQKGGGRVKQKLLKKPTGTVKPSVSTSSTARKGSSSSSPKSPTGLATPQSLKKIFGEHVESRGHMQLRDPDIREAKRKLIKEQINQIIEETIPGENKTFTLEDTYNQLVKNGLDDLSASIPTVDELLVETRRLQNPHNRTQFIEREVNDINSFLPYHLTEQFNADMTDENLVTKVRAIATKMWDPSTRYTNAKENTGALGMLRNTYVETELANPANQVINKWAVFYIQNGGTNGIDKTIATIPEAIKIIQSSLNYDYSRGAPVWSYIRGHPVPYSRIPTSRGGAEKNLVGGAGRGCNEANSLEHLIPYLGGLFSGVLASKKLKEIFEDFIDKTIVDTNERKRLKKTMSLVVLFLHPRECEDTNVAKSNQPLIKPFIYRDNNGNMLAQFLLVPPQYFTDKVGLKTSGSVGWWGLKEWNGSFKYTDIHGMQRVGIWDKKSYRRNRQGGFIVDADGNKYPLILTAAREELVYELPQIEPDFTKTTFTDGGWYQGAPPVEKLTPAEVRINQTAYINATLSTVNEIIKSKSNQVINDFFIAFWALINRKNPIPLSSTNTMNNSAELNRLIERNEAVSRAAMKIQKEIKSVTERNVNNWFRDAEMGTHMDM